MTLEFAQSRSIGSNMICSHYGLVGRGWLDNLKEYVASKKLPRDTDRRLGLVENLRQQLVETDRKSTRLNSSHSGESRMPSSA